MVRRCTAAALVANVAIVGTGGLVRLTGSGLGCPSWPDCAPSSLVPTPELSWHKYVEFGNRLFTYVVLAAAVAALVAVYRAAPERRDLRPWAWATLLGIPAQAVLGGITVLTDLNPWAVAAHFLLSMGVVATATVAWFRSLPPAATGAPPVALRRAGQALLALTFAVCAAGTTVTGAGPHAGDPRAARIPARPASLAQLHADLAMLLVGLAVGLAVTATVMDVGRRTIRATRWMVVLLAVQAVIGWTQYFLGLPAGLVEIHMLGAASLIVGATCVSASLSRPGRRTDVARNRDGTRDDVPDNTPSDVPGDVADDVASDLPEIGGRNPVPAQVTALTPAGSDKTPQKPPAANPAVTSR